MKKKKMGKAIERKGILRTILLLFFFSKKTNEEGEWGGGGSGGRGRGVAGEKEGFLSLSNSGLVTRLVTRLVKGAMRKEATGSNQMLFLVLRKKIIIK